MQPMQSHHAQYECKTRQRLAQRYEDHADWHNSRVDQQYVIRINSEKKQHLHAKDMQWLKWGGGQGLGPQFWFENPCSSMSPFMESELRLFRACAVYSTWRHTTVLMWRLTGGRPPLQRSTLSNRLAVLACVRCEGGPLLLNFRPMLLSSVWREIGSCLQYFFLSLFFYI